MNIVLTPISKRAKNRCNEHGTTFHLMKIENRFGEEWVLAESLENTWTLKPGVKQHWVGWFSESEANWEIVI